MPDIALVAEILHCVPLWFNNKSTSWSTCTCITQPIVTTSALNLLLSPFPRDQLSSMHMHTHMHVHTHARTHTHTRMRTHTHAHTRAHTHTQMYISRPLNTGGMLANNTSPFNGMNVTLAKHKMYFPKTRVLVTAWEQRKYTHRDTHTCFPYMANGQICCKLIVLTGTLPSSNWGSVSGYVNNHCLYRLWNSSVACCQKPLSTRECDVQGENRHLQWWQEIH